MWRREEGWFVLSSSLFWVSLCFQLFNALREESDWLRFCINCVLKCRYCVYKTINAFRFLVSFKHKSSSEKNPVSGNFRKALAIPMRVFALGSEMPFMCLSNVCCFSEHLIANARTGRHEYLRIIWSRSTISIVTQSLKKSENNSV